MVGPPTSPPDPGPRATHEHEWRPDEESPVFEDGAAIFFEYCDWVEVTGSTTSERHDETFYSYGAECDAQRSYRFDECYLWHADGRGTPLNASWDEYSGETQDKVMEITQNGEIDSICPDPSFGRVVLEKDENRLVFKA